MACAPSLGRSSGRGCSGCELCAGSAVVGCIAGVATVPDTFGMAFVTFAAGDFVWAVVLTALATFGAAFFFAVPARARFVFATERAYSTLREPSGGGVSLPAVAQPWIRRFAGSEAITGAAQFKEHLERGLHRSRYSSAR